MSGRRLKTDQGVRNVTDAKVYPPSQKTRGVNPWMNALCLFREGIVNIGSMFCFGGFRPEGIKSYLGRNAMGDSINTTVAKEGIRKARQRK